MKRVLKRKSKTNRPQMGVKEYVMIIGAIGSLLEKLVPILELFIKP